MRLDATLQRRIARIKNSELRGDAVLYIRVSPRTADDEGFHTATFGGVPYGFVYLDVSAKLGVGRGQARRRRGRLMSR